MAIAEEQQTLLEEEADLPKARTARSRVGIVLAMFVGLAILHWRAHGVDLKDVDSNGARHVQVLAAVDPNITAKDNHSHTSESASRKGKVDVKRKVADGVESASKRTNNTAKDKHSHTSESSSVSKNDVKRKVAEGVESASKRNCTNIWGVQLAEPESKRDLWKPCSAKWKEDCRKIGCCADAGLKCFRKDKGWATCKADCQSRDENNETWTCEVVTPPEPRTAETCFDRCRSSDSCAQAVFHGDGAMCSLAPERMASVAWAADNVNSTFCGNPDEQEEVKQAVDNVTGQLPFQMEWPLVNCSWGGEDCSETKCCNDYQCDKDYQNCGGFQCWKKTEYFSGCAAGPPDGWDGTWIGGPRDFRVVPPAASQVAVQGRSLYCFTVVTWDAPQPKPFWNTEAELANNWKEQGLHVLQCDGSDIIDGWQTPQAEWGSFSNIDMFMEIWQQVGKIGKWQQFDWTVKVDADAVFIPSRLKDHLWNLRTPKGARVYLENIDYKFKFMGAIEIMTREALALFLDMGHTCIRGKHEGGEDSFMKGCMNGLGIDHQSDYTILRDKYAAQEVSPCTDGWAVAYHYLKKTHDWSACYNEVMCGNPGWGPDGPCDKAIAVLDAPR